MAMGKPSFTQVELVEGREIIGKQSSWLVTLKGFDTPEKVKAFMFSVVARFVLPLLWVCVISSSAVFVKEFFCCAVS